MDWIQSLKAAASMAVLAMAAVIVAVAYVMGVRYLTRIMETALRSFKEDGRDG